MDLVEPIRDRKKVDEMKETLGEVPEYGTDKQILEAKRNRMLFIFGINIGLRISDIIQITIYDLFDENGQPRTHLTITEKKTKKEKKQKINKNLQDELITYIEALLYIQYRINYSSISSNAKERESYQAIMKNTFLFYSNKGGNMSRIQAYRILSESAEKCNIKNFGSHSLRKTFGYFHYLQHKDIALLMELFNHSAPSITLRYIGINQDILDDSMDNFYI